MITNLDIIDKLEAPSDRKMSVPSLKLICLGKFMPNQMLACIEHMDRVYNQDIQAPVEEILAPYGRFSGLAEMHDFNRSYDGWWGLPGPISKFTYDPYDA